MSKSRLNVVNPDDIVAAYGADALRLYEMFMGPLEMTKPWQTSAVRGMRHFLERAWRLVCDDDAPISPRVVDVAPDQRLLCLQHKTVRAVTEAHRESPLQHQHCPTHGVGERPDTFGATTA